LIPASHDESETCFRVRSTRDIGALVQLRKAAEITHEEIDAAADAYLANPNAEPCRFISGYEVDVADAVHAYLSARTALADPDRTPMDPAGAAGEGVGGASTHEQQHKARENRRSAHDAASRRVRMWAWPVNVLLYVAFVSGIEQGLGM
jgi:hypothetical protein